MALPPPLPDQQPSQTPQSPEGNPDKRTTSPYKKSGGNRWLIAGCILAGVLFVTALLLYFLTDLFGSDSYEYDDGNRHEKVLRQQADSNDVLIKAPTQTPDSARTLTYLPSLPTTLHGRGINGKGPMSLDININSDGIISGTYWNMFGNIEFNVQGILDSTGTLDMKMTTVKEGVTTYLKLFSTDGINYYGNWGKNNQIVEITLYEGPQPYTPSPDVIQSLHVSGVGLNSDVNISEDNGTLYYWYPDQGYGNRIRLTPISDGYKLVNTRGESVATITSNPEDNSLTLTNNSNQTFKLTVLYGQYPL